MRRLIVMALVAAVFGLGVLMGALLTPAARAQEGDAAAPLPTQSEFAVPNPAAPQYLALGRWQIVRVAAPTPTGAFTVLLDTQGGETFVLQTDRFSEVGISWIRLPRRATIAR